LPVYARVRGWRPAVPLKTTCSDRLSRMPPLESGTFNSNLLARRLPSAMPPLESGGLEFGHFPAPEEPDVCSAPLQRRAGSGGAECWSASSEIVGARLQSH
jgi:hypothetical protein